MIPNKPHNVMWSSEQWEAIYQSGQNILVSAGAGSGKTAVLSERIIEKLKQGIKLESLIVLTFTKAAASEMKERIRTKIMAAIKEGYNLNEQLDFIDQASIQTFDAFSLSLVRKYHYRLGISRNINIGDKVVLAKAKQDILDKVFDEYYNSLNIVFRQFLFEFTTKDDENIKRALLGIIEKIDLLPNSSEFLKNYHNVYFNEKFIKSNIDKYLLLLNEYQEKIKLRLDKMSRLISDDKLVEHFHNVCESLEPLLNSQTYDEFIVNMTTSLPRLPTKADEDEKRIFTYEREFIKEDLKSLEKLLTYSSAEEMLTEIYSLRKYTSLLIEIINKFYQQYDKFKIEHNIYEFLDIAKMGIKLLTENHELREHIKASTHEILIDEYQDTSDIQELFISLIANNNVYMVGDIKQSIYRFRNANPNIFKNKYEMYLNQQGGLLINLSKNYRSREEVIDGINIIFDKIMCANIGGVDYDEKQRLTFGNNNYAKNCFNDSYDLQVLTYNKEEQFSQYTLSEIEAFIIANDIKNKIANNYLIYDGNNGRPARYSDFTILTATKTKFETYKKIFEYLQIPLSVHKEESFVSSDEIYVIKNILICINSLKNNTFNSLFKAALISVLRSFIIELDDEVISRLCRGSLINNLKKEYETLYQKFKNLSIISDIVPLDELLLTIYQEFMIYPKLVKIGDVARMEDKLNFLATKAKELSLLGYRLEEFIEYFEWIIYNGLDIEFNQALRPDDNVVNIMSIHKSKGLEFSVCYFPELTTRFNLQELNERFMFSSNYGLIIPTYNEGVKDTFYKSLLKNDYRLDEISERIRLFYVALTRAKEQIILLLPDKEDIIQESYKQIPYVDRINYRNFADILYSVDFAIDKFKKKINLEHLGLTAEYDNIKSLNTLDSNKEYPIIDFRELTLRKKEVTSSTASQPNYKILSQKESENIDQGIKLHRYLEIIDFLSPIDEQLALIDEPDNIKEMLKKFFNHPLLKNNNLIRTFHEHAFSYQTGEGIINGIIDLILETNEELIIIDYKLLDIDNPHYFKQLKTYRDYLANVSHKRISGYLYSIINNQFKKIF